MLPTLAYVYELTVDGTVRYVGKGSGHRATEHLRRARNVITRKAQGLPIKFRTAMHRRLVEALEHGLPVSVAYLEKNLTEPQAYELEVVRIASYPAGQLWNIDRGGHGPSSADMRTAMASPEIRQRISEGTRRWLADPEVRAARRRSQQAAAATPESRQRRSEATKKQWADPAYRAAVIAGQSSPEVRQKMSAAAKARGFGFTSETGKLAGSKRASGARDSRGQFIAQEVL